MIMINKRTIHNYTLNLMYFERDLWEYKNDYLELCELTDKLDNYNILFDLKEYYISDNNYHMNVIDFFESTKIFINNKAFIQARENFIKKIKEELEEKINKLIQKQEEKNSNGNK